MFRTPQNSFDDVIAKATDENLTSENWEYILDVCDRTNSAENGPRDVVAAMIKRLAHRNANVQLYTLEVANALSQNCGIKAHRELASKSFTDALLRIASDRTTHQQVKSKILERMEEWTKMFERNPELGVMGLAYSKLKTQNPNIQPPQAPTKRQITSYDRQKEDEELQMALRLSVQESNKTSKPEQTTTSDDNAPGHVPNSAAPVTQQGTTAATVSRVRALYDFVPSEPGELQFRKGDVIAVIESVYKDWWKGSLRGQTGIFPLNYVDKLKDPTTDDLRKDAEVEAEVFGQIKNVERLLALLSTTNGDVSGRENEEITELYHQTVAIRPKLIELIAKYTQRKDDLEQVNQKFIKARRDYEALLEQSMAASAYGRPAAAFQPGYPPQPYQQPPPAQRFYTQDGGPPNAGMPYLPNTAPSAPGQFQPPYPVSSPPPPPTTQTPLPGGHQQLPYGSGPPTQQAPPRQAAQGVGYPQAQEMQGQYPPQSQPQQQSMYPPSSLMQPQNTGQSQYTGSIYSQPDLNQSLPSQVDPEGHINHAPDGSQLGRVDAYPHNPGSQMSSQQQQQQPPYPPAGGIPDGYLSTGPQPQYQAYAPAQTPQPQTAYAGGGNPNNFYR